MTKLKVLLHQQISIIEMLKVVFEEEEETGKKEEEEGKEAEE